jgi:cytochrome P450
MNPASATASATMGSVAHLPAESSQCPYMVVRDPEAVRDILHRPAEFSPANALLAVTPIAIPALRVLQSVRFALPPVLASNDTESHAGIRKVVRSFFTPAKVAAMEPRIRDLARESAVKAAGPLGRGGQVDLVQSVAAFTPAVVMLEILGLPVRDLPALKRWGLDSMELFWGWPDRNRQLELARSTAGFYTWLRELVGESVTAPTGNLFKSLHEHGLSTPEICSLGYFLLIAGQETTTQLISTTLFRLLKGTGPVTWQEAADGEPARSMVWHVLATESSVPTWRRVSTQDATVTGQFVPAGAEILLELTGTHDMPEEEEDLTPPAGQARRKRPPAYGLVFGSGIHRCLGAKLAELEATVIVQETAAALPHVRLLDKEPDWIRHLSFQAPKNVTVY